MGGVSPKVLAIFLDGYEPSLECEMRGAGELPALERLAATGSTGQLRHGAAQRTGLAGEHVSTGLDPEAARRFAAIEFDPSSYHVRQVGTSLPTFVSYMAAPTVVFDAPYFDLAATPGARGIVNWGAHDPGVPTSARPDALVAELEDRFGRYPASEFIYCNPWSSTTMCRQMGESLAEAVDTRRDASIWMLGERLPEWRFALVSVSESHSAIEGLWHGIDPDHPLAGVPSATPAGEGVRAVYRAIDRLVDAHVAAFPDATVLIFSMHGMGTNNSDVASMALLPELLYRNDKGAQRLVAPDEWTQAPTGPPLVDSSSSWSSTIRQTAWVASRSRSILRRSRKRLERAVGIGQSGRSASGLEWMPATWYRDAWPGMRAFALPSYYDGRVRVNLAGRERRGVVALEQYESVLDETEDLVRSCRDPATGESVVRSVERTAASRGVDPSELGSSEADLVVEWNGAFGFEHPAIGLIGPLPFKRTGGHTGPLGSVVIAGATTPERDLGVVSAFDIVPTIFALLGEEVPEGLSGEPLAASFTG